MSDPTPTPLTDAGHSSPYCRYPDDACPCTVSLLEHRVIVAAARADERERIITTAQVELDATRVEGAALRERVEAECAAMLAEAMLSERAGRLKDAARLRRDARRVRAALTTGADQSEPSRLFFVDATTGEPCPTDGPLLCTVTDWKNHLHRDGRSNRG